MMFTRSYYDFENLQTFEMNASKNQRSPDTKNHCSYTLKRTTINLSIPADCFKMIDFKKFYDELPAKYIKTFIIKSLEN